jgi:transposase
LLGLPEVNILGVEDVAGGSLFVETRAGRPGCPSCGVPANLKDRDPVLLVDLPAFGRRTRLLWRKRRFCCLDPDLRPGASPRSSPGSPPRGLREATSTLYRCVVEESIRERIEGSDCELLRRDAGVS